MAHSAEAFLSLVIVGHVDHGKSTVAGRLLADTGSLPKGKMEQLREKCARESRKFEYAFLLDSMKDEQAQRITIDTTRIFFRTPKRRYMLFDAPGHTEFLKNMVTGAAKANAAFLVIDAAEGVQENSRRHGLLLSLLGVNQVAVLVNKMDRVSHSKSAFERIRAEYGAFLSRIGVKPLEFIPTAAYEGENIASISPSMNWYSGPSVLEVLERFEGAKSLDHFAFRMPVQGVFPLENRAVAAGLIETGVARKGDRLVFFPSGKSAVLGAIEGAPSATAGRSVGLSLERTSEPSWKPERGELACRDDEPAPRVSSEIRARVFWLGNRELASGDRCVVKLGTTRRNAKVKKIESILSAETLEPRSAKGIRSNDVAELVLTLDGPMAHELGAAHPTLGRFVISDHFEICGGGVILG